MRDFSSIQAAPPSDPADMAKWLQGMALNVNLLAGLSPGSDNYAVLRGDISVTGPTLLSPSAPTTANIVKDIQTVASLLATLINQLQGN